MTTHKHCFGSKLECPFFLVGILCISILLRSGIVASAQTGPSYFNDIISAKHKRFIEYQKTFLNFAQSNLGSNDEYEVATSLQTTATATSDHLNSVQTLLEIYGDLSCHEDRARIQQVINRELAFYSELTGSWIDSTNLNIAHTRLPGVATESTRMRDDLREVKSIFEAIKFR
jgi:hypothetical protein